MAKSKRYEFIDHTADTAVRAYGDTIEQAFASAAAGMFDIITGGAAIDGTETVSFSVASIDIEGLLVSFLSQLIVIHEIESVVLTGVMVEFTGKNELTATARTEKFDRQKHGDGIQVKGVSYHMLEIFDGRKKQPCHVQVLFDV